MATFLSTEKETTPSSIESILEVLSAFNWNLIREFRCWFCAVHNICLVREISDFILNLRNMGSSDFSTGKSIVVIAIVVGCFAILWPKIFYPMMQAAFSMTSPRTDSEDRSFRPRDRPPHLTPERMPHLHEGGQVDKAFIKEGRPFPHPSSRQPVKPQAKTGGAMSIIMPIYTIGIVVFFLYTVLKLVFKKSPDVDKKPLIKDFHMDPDYHNFVCQQPQKDKVKPKEAKPKVATAEPPKPKPPADCNQTNEDYEIFKLRKKLEETETAMQRIMKHMGAVSECLSNACLLKDCSAAGAENKNIALETLLPESLVEPFKKKMFPEKEDEGTCKNRKRNKTTSNDEKATNVSDLDSNTSPTQDTVVDESCKNCDCSENASQKELKRDSSVNSETSSFEWLSQGLLNNFNKAVDGNTSDSDNEDSKECNDELSEKSTSSEAMDDVLDDDDNDKDGDDIESADYDITSDNKQDPIKKSDSEPLKEKIQLVPNH